MSGDDARGARRFALLVNPASAGGRALKALPKVHATLDRLGATHRTVTTRSIDHAYEEAGRAVAEGETVVALGGDGLLRPLAGALKGTASAVAIIPCGRGNDFARVLGIPKDPAEAARVAVEGEERLVDVANVEGTPFMGIASFGFDSDCNRLANEAKLVKGNAVYIYAALRTIATWKPATFTREGRRRAARGHRLLRRGRELEGLRRRHVHPAPGGARRRQARRDARQGQPDAAPSCSGVVKTFKGSAHGLGIRRIPPRRGVRGERRPPVRDLRRRGPDRRDARDDSGGASLPPSHRAVLMFRLARLLARIARATSRRVGRTGGTTAPGRLLLKASPHALARMSSQLEAGSVLVSATNGKTTTAAMIAAALERSGRPIVHNRAGSNMSWGVATALLDAGRERGQLGLFEVDEAWLPAVAGDVEPRLLLLSNLFRDQLDRYGELELLADRWAQLVADLDGRARFVLNADDPLVADLGRDRSGVTYFGVEDDSQALPGMQHAADSKHCRNCGHAYEYEAIYLGHLGRYRCPNCGRTRPEPQVAATHVELEGMKGSRFTLRTPHGELAVRLPLPGLYNVYNAVAAAATVLELGVAARHARRGARRASAAPSAAWRRSRSTAGSSRSC